MNHGTVVHNVSSSGRRGSGAVFSPAKCALGGFVSGRGGRANWLWRRDRGFGVRERVWVGSWLCVGCLLARVEGMGKSDEGGGLN